MDRVPLPCARLFRWPGLQGEGPIVVAGRGRSISGGNRSGDQLWAGSVPGGGEELYDALPWFCPESSLERSKTLGGQERGTGDRRATRIEAQSGSLSFCI